MDAMAALRRQLNSIDDWPTAPRRLSDVERAGHIQEVRDWHFPVHARCLGRFIRLRRTELGLSQSELARSLGLSQARIAQLERGEFRHLPYTDTFVRLAWALLVPLRTLLDSAGVFHTEAQPSDLEQDESGDPALSLRPDEELSFQAYEYNKLSHPDKRHRLDCRYHWEERQDRPADAGDCQTDEPAACDSAGPWSAPDRINRTTEGASP